MQELLVQTLETARLHLRPLTHADAPALFALRSDPEVMRFGAHEPWTDPEQASAHIRATDEVRAAGQGTRFCVERQAQPGMIGDVCVYGIDLRNRRCDLGYMLAPAHQGQGYMLEAVHAVLGYVFGVLALNRVEADVDPRNLASIRLLERLGFRREGYMPERWQVHGEVCDTVFYGLLKRYWQA